MRQLPVVRLRLHVDQLGKRQARGMQGLQKIVTDRSEEACLVHVGPLRGVARFAQFDIGLRQLCQSIVQLFRPDPDLRFLVDRGLE